MNDHPEEELSGIQFQPYIAAAEMGNLRMDYHAWTDQVSISQAKRFLKEQNIQFEEKKSEWDEDFMLLVTEGDVTMFFDCQREEGRFELNKAGRFIIRIISN